MSIYNLMNDPYGHFPSIFNGSSVYVISDSEMARYKRAQAQREINELQRLVDGHKSSIERLEKTIELLKADFPSEEKQPDTETSTPAD